jgi:aspartyl-tRNA synthetase
LSNGAPPHAGFALGLDRYIALLSESGDSKALIRDVIAFPKTKDGKCLMMDSPAKPPQELLDRYGIKVEEDKID